MTTLLKGASYKLEHCHKAGQKEKKHASDLSPYPPKTIPFQPADGADKWYGQLYKPISAHPFKEAGIKGFSPIQPYQVATNLTITNQCLAFCWPSLSELNHKVAPFCWESDDERQWYIDENSTSSLLVFTTGLPPAAPIHTIPTVSSIQLLVTAIVQSTACLFFVSCKFGDTNARKWRLEWVAFMDSISLYPLCFLDGRYFFEFFIFATQLIGVTTQLTNDTDCKFTALATWHFPNWQPRLAWFDRQIPLTATPPTTNLCLSGNG